MYAQKNRLALGLVLLASLLVSGSAEARRRTFGNTGIFSLGFSAGGTSNPTTTLIPGSVSGARGFTSFFSFEPSFDFGNFVIQPSVGLHAYPLLTGGGHDPAAGQNFNQSSDSTTLTYGARLLLIPMQSKGKMARIYIGGGGGIATNTTKSARNYLNAAGNITATNYERVAASTQYVEFFSGWEFFLVQNWSMAIEGGYRILKFGGFTYEDNRDVRGNFRATGSDVFDTAGLKSTLSYSGPYGALRFQIHF